MQIIDADGYINDHACGKEIAEHMPKGNQMAKLERDDLSSADKAAVLGGNALSFYRPAL